MQSKEGTTHRSKICPLHHRHRIGFGMLTYIHYINRNFLDFFRQDWSLLGPSIFSNIVHRLLPSSLHIWLRKTNYSLSLDTSHPLVIIYLGSQTFFLITLKWFESKTFLPEKMQMLSPLITLLQYIIIIV